VAPERDHSVVADTTVDTSTDQAAGSTSVPIVDTTDGGVTTRMMVLGLAHGNGRVIGSELYHVAGECGIPVETVRSCMRRLVNEGLFGREGEGRDAVFTATDEGRAALQVTHQRHLLAYAQDAAGRGWDRFWHMVAFAIPESQRSARDRFRDHLLDLGGAQLQPGLYVSPHPWEDEVQADAQRLGIPGHVTTWSTEDLNMSTVTDPREIAAALWDMDGVAAHYQGFIDTFRDVPRRLVEMRDRGERLSEHDFLPGALHIAIRFNDCFDRDPLLPPELLPRPWPGREAREILAKCRKLGVLSRSEKSGPALFKVFDDAIAHLP
jgi:phenylacetic acid degradation operon negative regulatory protein